ncbi:uncharacterized protein LOC143462117 [Clavelina lepadiformis]|uniref:uncharacterized protein LOC143462117 n=1 Tax=Clavelina lepadiformis TaxID=159417 RepID=UPI004042427B
MQASYVKLQHQSCKRSNNLEAVNNAATQKEMTLQSRNVTTLNKTYASNKSLYSTISSSAKSNKFLKEPMFYSNNDKSSCLLGKNISWSMIIFIKSAASYGRRREWIRKTWGSIGHLDGATFQIVFVIGQAKATTQALLDEEYDRYGDILQVDVSDAYQDVGFKTLSGMRWTSDKLPHQYFYSSGDDDMMIDLVKLMEAVDKNIAKISEEKWPEFPIICTYETRESSHPIRDKQHKNFISLQDYSEPNWPKFCLGGFYTTSVRVIRQLWEASLTSKRINTDDVFITGILRQKIGMPDEMVVPGISETCQHLDGFFENKFKTMCQSCKRSNNLEAVNNTATQKEMTLQSRNVTTSNKTYASNKSLYSTISSSAKSNKFLKEPNFYSNNDKSSCLLGKNISWSMIIFIKSAASYGIRREWIRKTWGSIGYLDGATFQIVFVIGQAQENYSESNWPKFCLGGFYTTSVRVIRQLWEASLTSKRINTDDVFITGILRQKIGMPDEMVVPGISETCQHLGGFIENRFKTMWSERKRKFENKSICFKP